MDKEIAFRIIGIVHSPFKKPVGVPIQPAAAEGVKGTVEVFEGFAEGLKGIEGFSHIYLIYYFHLAKGGSLLVKPYMDENVRGVFATRAPSRPNRIGISIVKLVGVEGNILHVEDIDIVDGTPLLDIKPYVPEFDIREGCKKGWLEENVHKLPQARDDGRFVEKE